MSAWLTTPNIFPQSFIKNGLNLTSLFMGHLMQFGKGIQGELRCEFDLFSNSIFNIKESDTKIPTHLYSDEPRTHRMPLTSYLIQSS